MPDTILSDAEPKPVEPQTADLAAVIAKARIELQAKRDALEDAHLNAASRAADRLLSGDAIAPAKDVSKLQVEYDSLAAAVKELESRHLKASAEARRKRLGELEAEAGGIHQEWHDERIRLTAIVIAATQRLVQYTQRSLPDLHMLFKNGEHVISLMEAKDPEAQVRLSVLRSEAESLGSGGSVATQLDYSPAPTPTDIAAAASLLASI